MIGKALFSAWTVTLVLLSVSGSGHAMIIDNGSFENGSFDNDGFNYERLIAGDLDLTGWTIVDTVAWGVSPTDGFSASDGVALVDLSSFGSESPTGAVQQLLTTAVGTEYLFSIDRQGGNIVVMLGGSTLSLTAGATSGAWTAYSAAFTATSSASLLTITNGATGNPVVMIDNVALVATAPSVPEPTTLLLLGVGLAGLRFARRRLH